MMTMTMTMIIATPIIIDDECKNDDDDDDQAETKSQKTWIYPWPAQISNGFYKMKTSVSWKHPTN